MLQVNRYKIDEFLVLHLYQGDFPTSYYVSSNKCRCKISSLNSITTQIFGFYKVS